MACLLAAGVACTSGIENPPDAAREDVAPRRDSAASPAQGLVEEDSLEAVATVASTLPDASVAGLDEASEPAPRRARRSQGGMRPHGAIAAVGGHDTEYRALAGLGTRVSAGVRSYRNTVVGFLHYRGSVLVRSFDVGNLKMRVGERLVLGRPFGSSPPSSAAPVREGAAVSPSLSRWFGRTGLAVDGDLRWLRSQLVIVADDRRRPSDAGAFWFSVLRYRDGSGIGVALGGRRGDTAASKRAVIDVFGAVRRAALVASGEVASYRDRRLFYSVRLAQARPSLWALSLYRAPSFSTPGGPMLALPPGKSVREGAGIEVRGRRAGAKLRVSLVMGRTVSDTKRRGYRRLETALSGRWQSVVAWEAAFNWFDEASVSYRGASLAEPGETARTGRGRGRLRLRVRPPGAFSHDVRLDWLPGSAQTAAGTLVSLGTRASAGPLTVDWRISAYRLPPGRQSSIARPGLGAFELFSAVYGDGTDIAVRFRWRPAAQLTISGYYGERSSGTRRVYLGAELKAAKKRR